MEQKIQTLLEIVQTGVKLTPMMEQYYQVKVQYPDLIVFFRMGDFYELFFEDAHTVSKLLNLSLTHRGKLQDIPIPMAGIPHHAAPNYIDRLTTQGYKIVICDQIEDPKFAKGIVKRAVTQIVSPGLPFDLDKALQLENKFIGTSFCINNRYGLVLLDYTTGDFLGLSFNSYNELLEAIVLYQPKEFITFHDQYKNHDDFLSLLKNHQTTTTNLAVDYFNPEHSGFYLEKIIPHYKKDGILKLNPHLAPALSALSYYIHSTQGLEQLSHLRPFRIINNQDQLKITSPTLKGLELVPKNPHDSDLNIFDFINKTKTSMGTRHLKSLFLNPLKESSQLEKRLNIVESFYLNHDLLQNIRTELEKVRDIDRIMAKASTKKINGQDTLSLATSLETYLKLEKLLPGQTYFQSLQPSDFQMIDELDKEIKQTLNDELGASFDKGNLILRGVNKKRDKLFNLSQNVSDELLKLENSYRKSTGINNLKIKANNISGYFIEVSNSHLEKIPKTFTRRQTLVNNERFVTEELQVFEKEISQASYQLMMIEKEIFQNLIEKVLTISPLILDIAKRLAQIDVYQSMAWIAKQHNFTRPQFSQEKKVQLIHAWHPLIKIQLKDRFVTHSLNLDSKNYFALITGPNMAGKTTVMREVAIIQFLAQIGSFVPAQKAIISIKDYLFSRLGASDDITKGQSTFMVEMSETAEIIRHATTDSLIILDEIGRGTSTYDGLSIAWSLVEHFVQKTKAITLFSTHYHELIELVDDLQGAKNLTVKTDNAKGKVQFLYELVDGGATQSFGIHVASLAGLPKEILKRSKEILKKLEHNQPHSHLEDLNQTNLFDLSSHQDEHELFEDLKNIDPLHLTPFEAHRRLQELKSKYLELKQ